MTTKLIDAEKVKALIKTAHTEASETFDKPETTAEAKHQLNGLMEGLVRLSAEVERLPPEVAKTEL